jgi:hypothetical protein
MKNVTRIICVLSISICAIVSDGFALPVSVELTSEALGFGTTEINYEGNNSAVEADRTGQLVTSTIANIGSVLTIQSNGLAGLGTLTDPLLVTVTAHTHMDTMNNLPAGYDFQAGVITLSKGDGDLEKEGLGVRAFGVDLDPSSANYAKRYVNTSYQSTNGHGYQMEGSKEVSGGVNSPEWADFTDGQPEMPSNQPPHVDEEVIFDFNNDMFAVEADSIKVLLTKIGKTKDKDPMNLGLDLTINLMDGSQIYQSFGNLYDDSGVGGIFSTLAGNDDVIQIDFSGASLGLDAMDNVTSFIIGARDDTADGPAGTDEHFLINGFSATVPEPMTVAILGFGALLLRKRKRKTV